MNELELKRYSRQILFNKIGKEGQEKLKAASVTIIGCGALGSVVANNLSRAGVGRLRLIDRDVVELENLQRQILFDEEDVKSSLPKAVATAAKLKKINSHVQVEAKVNDINPHNINQLIEDTDLIMDGTDNLETRFLINDFSVKNKIPWIYGAAIESSGMTMNIIPGETPCLRCFIDTIPPPGTLPTCDMVGVVNTVPNIIASLQSTEAIKLLLEDNSLNHDLICLNVWEGSYERVNISRQQSCPTCGCNEFNFLDKKETTQVVNMCGRCAVQITLGKETVVSLESLKERLEKVGEVSFRGYFLDFKIDEYELLIFPDGRAMIKGTEDTPIAKSLYTKYVGT